MEPILIYGFPLGSSMGLVAALEWLGLPHRLCRVDMLGEMREPPYARLNPRHETPVLLTDQGIPLTETMAIAAWLEARDIDRRISFDPTSPKADRMHQIMAFINSGYTAAYFPLWVALEMAPPDPQLQSTLRRWAPDRVVERHDRLEEMVDDAPFLAGEAPTLADALFIGIARWLEFHEIGNRQRWPRLARIRDRLEGDPAVIYATALENGEMRSGTGASLGHLSLAEVIERSRSQ